MKSVKLAALATTAALALTGCATGSPQNAAYVGPTPISLDQVTHLSNQVAAFTSDTSDSASTFNTAVVQILISSKIALATKLPVTDAERQQVMAADASLSELAKDPELADFVGDWVDAQAIVSTDAGRAAYLALAEETTVRLNPRFGTWDSQKFAIADGSTGSISEVAPIRQE
ncbi:MAG: hypothetical protein LCH96_05410 [Actinobacteria bacterium]|nr:hypothetical protein [Actinomycetota bacterium]